MDDRYAGPGFEGTTDVSNEADDAVGMQVNQDNSTEVEQAARRKMKHIIGLLQN